MDVSVRAGASGSFFHIDRPALQRITDPEELRLFVLLFAGDPCHRIMVRSESCHEQGYRDALLQSTLTHFSKFRLQNAAAPMQCRNKPIP